MRLEIIKISNSGTRRSTATEHATWNIKYQRQNERIAFYFAKSNLNRSPFNVVLLLLYTPSFDHNMSCVLCIEIALI